MHKCATCGRTFTTHGHLRRHSSRCRPKQFVCKVCNSSFGRERDLARHRRTVQCGGPPQPGPAPKRQKVTHLHEDPLTPPPVEPANDELSSAIRDAVRENLAAIRTHVVRGPVQTRFNRRLTSLDTRELHEPLRVLFDQQTTAFKINVSYGFLLKEKRSGRFIYYHSSCNCCGRLLEEPPLITNRDDFDRFLARIQESDILQWAVAQRPNSDWVCELVTNATFFIKQDRTTPNMLRRRSPTRLRQKQQSHRRLGERQPPQCDIQRQPLSFPMSGPVSGTRGRSVVWSAVAQW